MKDLALFGLSSIGVALTMVGDVFLKRYNPGSFWFLVAGLLFYSLGCIPVIFIFKLTEFGNVFILWEALTVILAVTIGHVIFGENVTPNKMVAVGLVICALVLMNR